jgi:hypothetical protein
LGVLGYPAVHYRRNQFVNYKTGWTSGIMIDSEEAIPLSLFLKKPNSTATTYALLDFEIDMVQFIVICIAYF